MILKFCQIFHYNSLKSNETKILKQINEILKNEKQTKENYKIILFNISELAENKQKKFGELKKNEKYQELLDMIEKKFGYDKEKIENDIRTIIYFNDDTDVEKRLKALSN